MKSIASSWEQCAQPPDERMEVFTNYSSTYRIFNEGLELLKRGVERLMSVAEKHDLRCDNYHEALQRISRMIEWWNRKREIDPGVLEERVSFSSLRYHKAGLILLQLEKLKQLQAASLPESVHRAIEKQFEELETLSEKGLLKNLRPAAIFFEITNWKDMEPHNTVSERQPEKLPTKLFEYDIALSFASEQRDYVEEVAKCLKAKGVKCFYDLYEKANLWGKDLYVHLDAIYGKNSRFCVLFASSAYAAKVWTNHERESAQARAIETKEEYILPVRFDETEIPGLRKTIGYIDAISHTPQDLCGLILEKLGSHCSAALEQISLQVTTGRLTSRLEGTIQHGESAPTILNGTEAQLMKAMQEIARRVSSNNPDLEIVQGVCGAETKWQDITPYLGSKVKGNSLSFNMRQPFTEIGGDPFPEKVKVLIIAYRYNREAAIASFREASDGLSVTLP